MAPAAATWPPSIARCRVWMLPLLPTRPVVTATLHFGAWRRRFAAPPVVGFQALLFPGTFVISQQSSHFSAIFETTIGSACQCAC
jgi:hypothetical protein